MTRQRTAFRLPQSPIERKPEVVGAETQLRAETERIPPRPHGIFEQVAATGRRECGADQTVGGRVLGAATEAIGREYDLRLERLDLGGYRVDPPSIADQVARRVRPETPRSFAAP
jgi:hypothetical protein